jgi:hypothetical protein
MKTKTKELDVDFIGSQESALTKDEEIAISEFIRSHKTRLKLKSSKNQVKI